MNKTKSLKAYSEKEKIFFFIHLLMVIFAWVGPFLFSWKIMLTAYVISTAQFVFFKSCVVNQMHGLDESDDHTYYAELFEMMGFKPNRKKLKIIVRKYLNIVTTTITLIWQVVLGFEPLIF